MTDEKFQKLGFSFREIKDDSGIVRDVGWDIENERFYLFVDGYYEVNICRKNPNTDFITICVESYSELEDVVYWIAD